MMMKSIIPLLVGIVFPMFSISQQDYEDSLILERQIHDKQFMEQVLNEEERKILGEICYFSVDEKYIVEAKLTLKKAG